MKFTMKLVSLQLYFIALCLIAAPSIVWSQNNNSTSEDEDDLKKEIIYDNKLYRLYNNWLSFGAGPAKNSDIPNIQFAIDVDYNFHIKKQYFQVGTLLSGDDFGTYNNVQGHICYVRRKENTKMNFSYLAGPSFTKGYEYRDSVFSNKAFTAMGLYACVQLIAKIKYDVGIGSGIFADVNGKRSIIGIRLDFYFSNSYKGGEKR